MKHLVAVGAAIFLLASCQSADKEQPDITIADLVGMNSDQAVSMIDHLDLAIEVEPTDGPAGAQGGTVLKMEPAPGTTVESGSTVTLFVAPERELQTGERPFRLLTHCGLSFPLRFQKQYWLPVNSKLRRTINAPRGFTSHGYYDRGTIQRVDEDTLIYTSSTGVEVGYEPATVTTKPGCE